MTRHELANARLALFLTIITPQCAAKFGKAVRLLIALRAEEANSVS